jgi:N-acyl homoserine lactone hydrolase
MQRFQIMFIFVFFTVQSGLANGQDRIPFVVPKSDAAKDWATILSQPKNITLTTLETGTIQVQLSEVLNLDNPRTKGFKDSTFWVPVFAHWIHHETYGDYLIDSGLDSTFTNDPHGNFTGLYRSRFTVRQAKGQDITAQLAVHGIKLKGVFFTHLHPDHTTGVPGLPKNISFVAGKGEKTKQVNILFIKFFNNDHFAGVSKIEEIDFAGVPTMPPLGSAVDVFGDGSLWAIATPGHTIGHLSFLVNAKSGAVLLAGDASHTKWGFENGVEPGGFTEDVELNHKTLAELKAFAQAFPQVKVICGHER